MNSPPKNNQYVDIRKIFHMTDPAGERAKFFPAIEKKHGQPIRHWFTLLASLGEAKYVDQIALLREEHGFSQAHANAVVMHHRGSTSSRRHTDADAYFASIGAKQALLTRAIIDAITKKYPKLELVIAWNQPMLKSGNDYVIGISAAKNHLTIGPWGKEVISTFADDLADYETNKKTFKVPLDWRVDAKLLHRIVRLRLDELP